MDSSNFDGYTSYSDSSTPRTPSPDDMHFLPNSYKHVLDTDAVRNGFPDDDGNGVAPELRAHSLDTSYWPPPSSAPNPYAFSNDRGSLLSELYDHDIDHHQQQQQQQQHPPDFQPAENWPQLQHQSSRTPDYHMMRRATFPYVRHDRDEGGQAYPPFMQHRQDHNNHSALLHPYPPRQDSLYELSLPSESTQLHGEPFITSSPHSSYHEFDETRIKLEDNTPHMVPSQMNFYRPPSSSSQCHPMAMSYLSPHTGLPVQHTDDAASKETQYLRRRCFNCHTTEPPSWRRSTLNPGKIVCNKCGLYERTHLRPRPLRFDELRAGNKARKQSKGTVSPKQRTAMVKKEPREYGLVRRSSVSSTSSVHSGSGASDWDDNVSVYSSGSAPPTSYNSPNLGTFPLSRDSQSPPRDGGIRLPNAPLSDVASLHQQTQHTPSLPTATPRKSHTSPPYFSPNLAAATPQQDYFSRESVGQAAVSGVEAAAAWAEAIGNVSGLVASPVPTPVAS